MPKKMSYTIKKLEKGPLQRFKNQNLLLKKFGEVGLKIYRSITGRRTVEELKKDLGLADNLFDPVITYMTEAGMVELTPAGKKEEKPPEAPPEPVEEVEEAPEEEVPEEAPEEEIAPEAPEIEAEEEAEEAPEEAPEEEEKFFEDIEPIKPEGVETEPEEAPKEEEEEAEEEVEPIEAEAPEEEAEEEPEEAEEVEEEAEEIEAEEKKPGFDFEIEAEAEEEEAEEEELSSVEKIIKGKYGDTGVQVYNLIDGEKTAEEIMREVGISESKLIEILDFMDKQGIIKLEYPGEKKEAKVAVPTAEEPATGFVPILETERMAESKEITIPNPIEVPAIVSVDIIKSVQMKAKVMFKFKDEGKKIYDMIDGKKDVIDISLKVGTSLPMVYDVLNYLMDNNVVVLKPMLREYVKKKYGDDGYNIYKRYGREGLMLYELIGRDMTFKQMADMVIKDKERAVDMFLFIHEVLGIELPIDRDVLSRQLGI